MSMHVPWSDSPWRRVLIYGLGLSGTAAARWLLRRGVEVVGLDARPASSLDLGGLAGTAGFSLFEGREPQELPEAVDGLVVSPGVPPDRPVLHDARRRGVPVIAEVELAFPFLEGDVVGITGSNGKSTTTALTGALLRAAGYSVEVCGNIGEPLCAVADGPADRIFVVELSSFQLEGIRRFRPRAAALLNISADHLDRHGSLSGYRAAKIALFRNQGERDVTVLNADDPQTSSVQVQARRRFFSLASVVEDGCYLAGDRVLERTPEAAPLELFRRADLPLEGRHNLENAMAAALLARAFEAEPAAIVAGLRGFAGLPHRMERVVEHQGVLWYDDSKGTNPGATLRSLEGFGDGSLHLILGGRNKGADLSTLRPMVERKARRVYLIGEASEELRRALGSGVEQVLAGTLEQAVTVASGVARPGETVLLSPACASFDQFRSFTHRGEVFQNLVRALGGGGAHG